MTKPMLPSAVAAPKLRGRALGLPFSGECGQWNALTDVPGVEIGQVTLISGQHRSSSRDAPIRTGVTVIRPHGHAPNLKPVWAGFHALNGNGEMTGMHWVKEGGYFIGAIGLTNTHSVGTVHQALLGLLVRTYGRRLGAYRWALPVVGETCDAYLNDMNGFHVREEHVVRAFETAASGPVVEGNAGGGTGMVCYDFKGGNGTASRIVSHPAGCFTVGAFVQANMGLRAQLSVLGVPVGRFLDAEISPRPEQGSIIVLIGTDAPLLPLQLQRLARRGALGIARTGSYAGDGSGDLCLAFSTANSEADLSGEPRWKLDCVPDHLLDPFFLAAVEAVEEAIINALLAADSIDGVDGTWVNAIDQQQLVDIMRRHNRLSP
jgi:D-aminopeptidase